MPIISGVVASSKTGHLTPLAPTIGAATASSKGTATVAYTASGSGPTATSFTATSSPGGFTGTGTTSPITVTGLSNGTSYTFTVHATNAQGSSSESSASNSITTSAPASTYTLAQTFNSSGSFTPSSNAFYVAVLWFSAGSAGFAGTTPASSNTSSNLTGGAGGTSGAGFGFTDYLFSNNESFNVTVGSTTSFTSNINSTLAQASTSGSSNVSGASFVSAVAGGNGGNTAQPNFGTPGFFNGSSGNQGGAQRTLSVSNPNVASVTIYGGGAGGGGGAYGGICATGSATGGAATGGGGVARSGAGGNVSVNTRYCAHAYGNGGAGCAGLTPGGGGGGGGGAGVVGRSGNNSLHGAGGSGGAGGGGVVYVYTRQGLTMSDVVYGFVNSSNLVIGIAYFVDGDTDSLKRVNQEYKASAYYKIDEASYPVAINSSIWAGSYFTPGCVYSTWKWDDSLKTWIPPIPYPVDEKNYEWSDSQVNWVEVTAQYSWAIFKSSGYGPFINSLSFVIFI